jgi:flavin-binding protein dodecin
LPAGVQKTTGGGGAGAKTSTLLAGRAENIREAFAQASKDIVNITKFPKDTMLGSFAGLTGASADSMVGAIRNGIARGVTDKEQRMLETLLAGIEGHMAFALGGGYASSQSKARMDQYKAQIARAGDDPAQVPLMLARFRQEMNTLAENFPSKPGATPEMNNAVQKYNDAINNAVPFTVDDVLTAELGSSKKDSGKSSSAGGWKIKER